MGTPLYERFLAEQGQHPAPPQGMTPLYQRFLAEQASGPPDANTVAAKLAASSNLTPQQKALHLAILARNQQGQQADMARQLEEGAPLPQRVGHMLSAFGHEVVSHPLETLEHVATAPAEAFANTFAPTEGSAKQANDPNSLTHMALVGRFGDVPEIKGVTGKERAVAGAQLAANVTAPELGPVLGGAITGYAYSPDDPLAGAATGALLGTAAKGLAKGVSGVTQKAFLPGTQAQIKLLQALEQSGLTPEDAAKQLEAAGNKPLTIADIAGKPGVRLARVARSASPAADQEITSALEARNAGSADRAIQDALQATGLQKRTSAFQTTNKLVEERSADADKAYAPAFADKTPIADPRLRDIFATPAVQAAWTRAVRMMRNKHIAVPESSLPTEGSADVVQKLVAQGVPADKAQAAAASMPSAFQPTIQQLHYLKLALDDAKRPGLNQGEGAGGLGYNEGSSIHGVQQELLNVMDDHSDAYRQARGQYADKSALLDANKMGRQLFKMDPEEAAAEYNDLGSEAEKEVFRRAGMDALADRLENGPADPSKPVSKVRDMRRMRLLFPDDASFEQFRQSIGHESQMVRNGAEITGGSQTADKLADLANMLNMPVGQAISAAARGPGALSRLALSAAVQAGRLRLGRAVADELAPYLTAGARGDVQARAVKIALLKQLAEQRGELPEVGHHAVAAAHIAGKAGSQAGTLLPANEP